MIADGHIQIFSRHGLYVAAGTEILQEYSNYFERIGRRAEEIRQQLGTDQLRWFHF